jgi:single-stranded-DNA-specific exonuclease
MARAWVLRPVDPELVRRIARQAEVPAVLAHLLAARGHADPERARAHVEAGWNELHDPDLLPDMEAATARLELAVRRGETILVHGDYDVDGVTGTALLVKLFRLVGAKVEWHVPDRKSDGYSFGAHSVARARELGATVVVSVDNGTSSAEVIAELARHGIDTVVTDHHEPPPNGPLPAAAAIVNPKLQRSRYPFRELCGSGVAFKLAWGLARRISGARRVREDLRSFLVDATAFAALATVCDVVPLVGENRILARRGLQAIERAPGVGLRALLAAAGLARRRLVAEDVGYAIGPRLNAAGRLASAGLAIELFLTEDPARARDLAAQLEALNLERRRIEAEITAEACAQAADFADRDEHPVLVLAREGWHQGVVGIVAARVAERFGRPALVIGLDGESGRGSARSVPGFDVHAALAGAAEHMLRFGGHAAAAGCEVRASAVPRLRAAVCARARELLAGAERGPRPLAIDLELPLAAVDEGLMRVLERLEPCGAANEKPVLLSTARLAAPPRAVGGERAHLALHLRDGERVHRAMAFGMGARERELALGVDVHAVHTPRWNTFRGETTLELLLHDFAVGERPPLGYGAPAQPAAAPAQV